jgi:hypothetical protein
VGDTIYIRAQVTPAQVIPAALVQINVYYSTDSNVDTLTPIISIPGLDFCTLSTKFSCPLQPITTIVAWEFEVPDVPAGTYQVVYNIIQMIGAINDSYLSCIQFPITVNGPSTTSSYTSWYQATLLGSAVFSNPDYTARTVGNLLQVGPAGPLNVSGPPYGSIQDPIGSGDLVPSFFSGASGLVWGLNGLLIKKLIGATNAQQSHTYEGECYLGYISGGYNYDYINPLLSGTFTLTFTYTDSSTAVVSGSASFEPAATIPPGWGYPLLFGSLDHQISTSDSGIFMISASKDFCSSLGFCVSVSAPASSASGSGLPSDKLGLAIGLPIAVVFVVVLVAAALLYAKHKRETEQEDGIFAVARKPEYGSALVVDDIIEETRGNKNLRNMLAPRAEPYSVNGSEDDEEDPEGDESDDGSVSRSRSRSRSESPSHRSESSKSRSRSRGASDDEESDPGESASREESKSDDSD